MVSKPDLFGRRILVTRAAEQARSMVDAIVARGGVPVCMPVVEIRLHDLDLPDVIDDYDHVLLPSVNAARALAGRTVAAPTMCVGAKTAAFVRSRADVFVGSVQSPDTFRAEAMLDTLDEIYGGDWNRRLLLLRGGHGRDVLAEGARAKGAHVHEVVAYAMQPRTPTPEEIAAPYDVATFLSGATLETFLDVVPDARHRLERAVVAVIGPVAAERASALAIRVDVVPNEATVEALLDAL